MPKDIDPRLPASVGGGQGVQLLGVRGTTMSTRVPDDMARRIHDLAGAQKVNAEAMLAKLIADYIKASEAPKWDSTMCYRIYVPLDKSRTYYFKDIQEDPEAIHGMSQIGLTLRRAISEDVGTEDEPRRHENLTFIACGSILEVVKKPEWLDGEWKRLFPEKDA